MHIFYGDMHIVLIIFRPIANHSASTLGGAKQELGIAAIKVPKALIKAQSENYLQKLESEGSTPSRR